ncbi:hypothetical protein [Pseudomonas nitroreducens]|uniref:hypothetical protein n=1 Tax=Pseudomonas nitroreducens TaxID=46680 RepID=UPI003CC81A15
MAKSHALNPSDLPGRIAAHKAMAIAALHANSSLATRLKRYNHHMTRARSLLLLQRLTLTLRAGGAK